MQSSQSAMGAPTPPTTALTTLLALKVRGLISDEDYKALVQDRDVAQLVSSGTMTATDIVLLCNAMAVHGQDFTPRTSMPTPTPHPQTVAPFESEGGNLMAQP